jgi:hypothetical protein
MGNARQKKSVLLIRRKLREVGEEKGVKRVCQRAEYYNQ